MPKHFDFGTCLNDPADNLIYLGCCQRITCNVENIHNTKLDINAMNAASFNANWNVQIVSINGSAPSFPFQVASGGTFEIVFDVCNDLGVAGGISFTIQTVQHGVDPSYDFNFNYISSTDVSSNSLIFGTVPQYSPSTPYALTITNDTSFEQSYTFNPNSCPNEFTYSPPLPIVIPSGSSEIVDIIWTPTGPNEDLNGCQINICNIQPSGDLCNCEKLGAFGDSTPATCECLCLEEIIIETVEDGTTLMNDINWNANDTSVFNQSSICSSKKLKYVFNHLNIIDTGFKVWFNPWMFAFTCDFDSLYPSSVNAPPPQGWFIEVNTATMSIGGVYLMNLIGTGSNQFSQTNFNVYFGWTDATNFQIWFDFYHIYTNDKPLVLCSTLAKNHWSKPGVSNTRPA